MLAMNDSVNANSKLLLAGMIFLAAANVCVRARAQLVGDAPLPARQQKHKQRSEHLEWMWQYGPPPAGGREHELIQDPHFRPFLDQNFSAPQSFWGLQPDNVKDPRRKSLPDTIEDFLDIPGTVTADDNRYITVTGAVFHFGSSRGLLFADLDSPHPLLAFAAIDWIRDGHTTAEASAQYTLWLFTNRLPGASGTPFSLPPPLLRSLTRWMSTPLPGSEVVQHIRAAILAGPDGTPHQIPIPGAVGTVSSDSPQLPRRAPSPLRTARRRW